VYPGKITRFCSLFGFTKQAYYKSGGRSLLRIDEEFQARKEVMSIRRQMPRLGTRKLCHMLKEVGIEIGRDRLFRVLGEDGMLIVKRRKYTVTTNSKHWMRKYPTLIKDMLLYRPEQLWVADITYLDTLDGHGYLHLVTDAYSKQIMGYELCDNMEAASTLKALKWL
jgi:putative transposase